MEMSRGHKQARKAKTIVDLPQIVRLEYDRGRVAVAVQIEPSARWGANNMNPSISLTGQMKPAKNTRIHQAMITAIAMGLDNLLAYNGTGTENYQAWDQAEDEARRMAARSKRNSWIALGVIVAIIILIVIIGIVSSNSRY